MFFKYVSLCTFRQISLTCLVHYGRNILSRTITAGDGVKMLPWKQYCFHNNIWTCDMTGVESTINIFCSQPLKSKGFCEHIKKASGKVEIYPQLFLTLVSHAGVSQFFKCLFPSSQSVHNLWTIYIYINTFSFLCGCC
jgi:hypothetical protein